MMVTSIIISRDGQDLATLIDHFSAKPVSGTSGFTVTGQLTPGAGEGFLELVWPHPDPQDAGSFKCDVATISAGGRNIDFSKTLVVAEEEVTIADLVAQLNAQQTVIDGLTVANAGLKSSIDVLKQTNANITHTVNDLKLAKDQLKQENVGMNRTIDYMIHTNTNMNHTIDHLTQIIANMNRTDAVINNEIIQLKSAKVPNVFFTATYNSSSHIISDKHVVVYNDIIINEGGAYSSSTGIFISPVSGFYHFEFSAVSNGNQNHIELQLQKNGNFVVEAYTYSSSSGADHDAASNSAIIHLAKGDTVKVVSAGTSYLFGHESWNKWNTFTGQLIALD